MIAVSPPPNSSRMPDLSIIFQITSSTLLADMP